MSKKPKLQPIPKFRDEAAERKFWETHDSTDYLDWSKAKRVRFPSLKLSTTAISLRLPQGTLDRIKVAANKRDVPIPIADQSLAGGETGRRMTAPVVFWTVIALLALTGGPAVAEREACGQARP
jgi:hypothetical protein